MRFSGRKLISFATAAALLAAAPAFAQLVKGRGDALKPDEVKAALFGIDMQGYSPSSAMSWRECIDPKGETLYEIPGRVMHGRLVVSPDGLACFSYDLDDYSSVNCFVTFKSGDGLRFEGDFGALFVTTKVVTGVRSCERQLIG
jgi:hypothetical protein